MTTTSAGSPARSGRAPTDAFTGDSGGYGPTAPFYDLLAGPWWDTLGPAVGAALDGADPAAGPIIDLGAGTGLSTIAIADALPDAEVWAVEPSPVMRTILLSRLAGRRDLHPWVTVVVANAQDLVWPDQVGAVVAANMIGHLPPSDRSRLWATLAARLAPGAPAVVGLQPPPRPERLPNARNAAVKLGADTYEGWAAAEPTAPDSVRWTMTYRITHHDEVRHQAITHFDWWTISADDIAAEATAAGLTCRPADADLYVLRRLRSRQRHGPRQLHDEVSGGR
jgi:SAM-dependent methyltransferase